MTRFWYIKSRLSPSSTLDPYPKPIQDIEVQETTKYKKRGAIFKGIFNRLYRQQKKISGVSPYIMPSTYSRDSMGAGLSIISIPSIPSIEIQPSTPTTKQIFFDCDNTLINTEEISFEAAATVVNKVMADQGLDQRYANEELIDLFFALTARQMITELQKLHAFTLTPQQVANYTQYEEDVVVELLLARPNPCPGVEAVLSQLVAEKKYTLAVVSSSPIKRVRAALTAGGIAKYFDDDQIFSAKNSMPKPISKPDPAIYQWAMMKNGVKPEECIAFEDSRSGARSSISAGIDTVAYVGAYSGEDQRDQVARTLMEEGCKVVMKHYDQFFDVLALVAK